MKVQVFAGLKEHFDPTFEVDQNVYNIYDLKQRLVQIRPSSATLLESCRFAVNNDFIDDSFELRESDLILILPPSSGG